MISFFNSLTNKKYVIKDKKTINIYCCGPTVYSYIHIGNARPIILTDTIIRFLNLQNINVNFLSNITDIDDKIINKSIELNKSEGEITSFFINEYLTDIEKMNIIKPNKIIKVTEEIDQIKKFIEILEANNSAYEKDGNVFFSIDSLKDEYGKLSNQNIEMLENSEKNENINDKKNPLDFALWKKTNIGIKFDSKWGKGRPGWHTECSVFNDIYFNNTIDLHIGGIDLKFPHHENERIQFIAKNNKELSSCWIYNGHLSINSEKMSKSLNNTIHVRDFINKNSAEALRYIFLNSNYKNPINITDEMISDANKWNQKNINLLKMINWKIELGQIELIDMPIDIDSILNKIISYFNDDINTPMVITELDSIYKSINNELRIKKINKNLLDFYKNLMKKIGFCYKIKLLDKEDIKILNEWNQAVTSKDYELSDKLRNLLIEKGIM